MPGPAVGGVLPTVPYPQRESGGAKAVYTEGWRAMCGLLAVGRPRARPVMGQTACWAPCFGWGSRPASPEPLCARDRVRAHLILTAAEEGGPSGATCPSSQMARGGPTPRRPVPLALAPRTAQSTAMRMRHGAQSSGYVQAARGPGQSGAAVCALLALPPRDATWPEVAKAGRGGWSRPWRSYP